MTVNIRKKIFIKLGDFLTILSKSTPDLAQLDQIQCDLYHSIREKMDLAVHHNGWFTQENVLFAFNQWANALREDELDSWLSRYAFDKDVSQKTVAIIMAGNIPLVGFHDFLSVLLSGHKALVKLSSNDKLLLPLIAKFLINEDKTFADLIEFTDKKLENFDAVIATGSNNTARYFDYYFSKHPNIIRKNRNSVAVLTGHETDEQLRALGEDVFRYFGLGCRNVSKLYVPEGYNFDRFFEAIFDWNPIMNHAKYANNYDYNKAVYLMSEFKLLDNGFLLLKEDKSFGSPIATLFWQSYNKQSDISEILQSTEDTIQCVVSDGSIANSVAFGQTQMPKLWDYADGVDTLVFLTNL